MTQFAQLRAATISREAEWDPDHRFDLSFLGNATAGEVGEACNIIKKLERERLGFKGSRASIDELAEELADVILYIDIIAMRLNINLWDAIVSKFNAVSDKLDFQTRLSDNPHVNLSSGENQL